MSISNRSDRFIIVGLVVSFCFILLGITIFKPSTAPILYPLIASWMASIFAWIKMKSE